MYSKHETKKRKTPSFTRCWYHVKCCHVKLCFMGVNTVDPIKYALKFLWLILYDHTLFLQNDGLKYMKVIFYRWFTPPPIKDIVEYPFPISQHLPVKCDHTFVNLEVTSGQRDTLIFILMSKGSFTIFRKIRDLGYFSQKFFSAVFIYQWHCKIHACL